MIFHITHSLNMAPACFYQIAYLVVIVSTYASALSETNLDHTCGIPAIPPAVVSIRHKRMIPTEQGGKEATPHSWPWMVVVSPVFDCIRQNGRKTGGGCGGTLLKVGSKNESDIVLSAAHCVRLCLNTSCHQVNPMFSSCTMYNASDVNVTLGDHHINKPEPDQQTVPVESYVIHHDYFRGNDNADLVIMKLRKPVTFGSYISPICLPSNTENPIPESLCYITGWGDLHQDGRETDTLQQLHVFVHDDCKDKHHKRRPLNEYNHNETICFGEDSYASGCPGDSGGPVVCKFDGGAWTQYGIVSRVQYKRCSSPEFPGLFVRVSHYSSWIMEQARKLSAVY